MANLQFYDRVKETTTTTGTGTITLDGAVTGYQSFSVVGNGITCYYCIEDQTGSNWEVGSGTYTSSGTTLSRSSVLASSNGGSLVSFGAGTKNVFLTAPATILSYLTSSTLPIVNLPAFSGFSEASAQPQPSPSLTSDYLIGRIAGGNRKIRWGRVIGHAHQQPGGRLTLTSGTPCPGDVTDSSSLYYESADSDFLPLYSSSNADFECFRISDYSISIIGLTPSSIGTKTGNTTSGSAVVSGMSNTTSLYAGAVLSGTGIGTGTRILTVDSSSQITLNQAASATNTGVTLTFYHCNYDVFAYLSSGTPTLQTVAWSDATTRATGIIRYTSYAGKGYWVKDTGDPTDPTYLLLGTIRMSGNGTVSDSDQFRGVSNIYNKKKRRIKIPLTSTSNPGYTATSTSWVRFNSDSSLRVELVRCLDEEPVILIASIPGYASSTNGYVGFGLDSISVLSTESSEGSYSNFVIATPIAMYNAKPGIGAHFLQLINEVQDSGGYLYTFGNYSSGNLNIRSNVSGEVWA